MTESSTVRPPTGRSWPLFLVAGLSWVPGVGFFFGAVALIWGLLSKRPRAVVAGAIGGAGALLNMVGGVLLVWRLQQNPAYSEAFATGIQTDLVKLVGALENYRATKGRYPASLMVFTQLPLSLEFVNVQDHSAGILTTPRLYQYEPSPDGQTYDLFAVGPDSRPGTADDVRPLLPDSLATRSGYRGRH